MIIPKKIVSVKGGQQLTPAVACNLRGTVGGMKEQVGLFICLAESTAGMLEVAATAGLYLYRVYARVYPKLKILTERQVFEGKRPGTLGSENPFKEATPIRPRAA